MKIGYQLSSITPYLQTETELRASLQKIAALGYRDVQLQGASAEIPDAVIADALREAGLNCVAIQVDYPDGFGICPEKAIRLAVACKAKYLTFAVIPKEIDTTDKLQTFAENICSIHKSVTKAGLVFAFHPIGPDFRLMDGIPVYERLMASLPDTMQLTFCVSSCFGSTVTWQNVLTKYTGRMDLVHFKDGILLPNGQLQLMPLGAGRTDWQPIAAACAAAGVKWAFAEQERWQKDAFVCAADSLNYLNTLIF